MTKKNFYIDFYKKNNISPVLNSFKKNYFFNQRKALYSHLAIDINHIKGKDVIEFGPGNGINSIHTYAYKPKSYTFVDANPKGLSNLKKNLNKYVKNNNYFIVNSFIENYKNKTKFDLVICEGLLPNSLKPEVLTKHCSSFVKKNGIYIITCHDHISTLSETMRCLLSIIISHDINNLDTKISKLADFFDDDFNFLKNMSRNKRDWILDNFINKEFWQDAKLFSISDSIKTLKQNFVFKSSSPNYFIDWNWYKNIKINNQNYYNNLAISCYELNKLNFLDTRVISNFNDLGEIKKIYQVSKKIRKIIKKTSKNLDFLPELINECKILSNFLPNDFKQTSKSIDSYVSFLETYLKKKQINKKLLKDFRSWWGRGMQYVSFQKI